MDRAGLACPGNATGGLGARLRALQASGGVAVFAARRASCEAQAVCDRAMTATPVM